MSRNIRDMVVVITGASAGIGLALARELSHKGALLVLAARRLDILEKVNAELGGNHLVVRADVSQSDDCRSIIDAAISRFGRIDTLVCNAGYGVYTRVDETDAEQVRRMMDVDVIGTTECIRHAVPHLRKQKLRDGWRGQIMIVSSAAARRGTPFIGVYSGAKAAQLAIAEALRVELVDDRIAVTTVHPTPTKSEFGQVAENLGKYKLPPSEHFTITQTAAEVGRIMARAIARPRREVWPRPLARLILGIGTLLPGMMDWIMHRYYQGVVRYNQR